MTTNDTIHDDACAPAPIVTRAWKGFDKNLVCRGHQFAVGHTYTMDGTIEIYERGWHAHAQPLDVLQDNPVASSRYAEVEIIGPVLLHREDSKVCGGTIRVVREIEYRDLWSAHREMMQGVAKEASATGERGHASATGIDGIAVAVGIRARAKAAVGGWIVLSRYDHDDRLVEVKTAQIGTNCLRPNVWYSLNESGEFVEAT